MKTEKLRALLEAELEEAKLHYIKCKKALDAFIKANKTSNVKLPIVDGAKSRENLKQLVLTAIKNLPVYQPFTTVEVFEAMQREDLVYENVRPRISMWLSKFAKEGRIIKKSRGTFAWSRRKS